MSRTLRHIAIPAATLILAAAGCSSTTSKSSPPPPTTTNSPTVPATTNSPAVPATTPNSPTAPPTTTAPNPAPTTAAAAQIVIDNFAFSPAKLTVHAGQSVTVVNHDSATHTLTASSGGTFDTGAINPGKSATFTAPATPGTYSYICGIHASMHGTLTVG